MGKSTLFNRLVEQRQAIVDEVSGVTRDRNYGKCHWNGTTFSIIDTGGYVESSQEIFDKEIRRQVELAIEEAHIILFVLDAHTGIGQSDQVIARLLRATPKKVLLLANKVDNVEILHQSTELYRLGWDRYYPIAANSGSGTGELLDEVVKLPTPTAHPRG